MNILDNIIKILMVLTAPVLVILMLFTVGVSK